MHIIFLETQPTSLRGGQELSLLDVCRGLSQRGHRISLLYKKEGNLLDHYREFCEQVLKTSGFTINRKTNTFNFLGNAWNTAQKIPQIPNSIVYINQYLDSPFGYLIASFKKIPLVCHLRIPPADTPHDAFLDWQWNIGVKGVKQFIAVSNQTKSDWIERGFKPETIEVVHNGIKPELFKPSQAFSTIRKEWNIPENIRVISYVGRLDREKGLETLIKAFALLLKRKQNIQLLIAGKPVLENRQYQTSLEQLSRDLGIEQSVVFLGHVTNTISLYQVSDVTVLPSLNSEAFGRVIIESMSCGTPVVASRTGGIPEILTGEFQSGLFQPGNEQDLSNTLDQTLNWRNENPQLSDNCRQHILHNFNLDKTITDIEKVLLKVTR